MSIWKNTPKIDAHIHVLPDAVIAANQGVEDPFVQAGGVAEYVRRMEENHISQAVVMPFNDPFLMSMEFSVTAVHDNLLAFRKRYGDRFLLFADVDTRNRVEESLAELDRVMATGAFAGIKLHPTNTGLPLDGAYFDAIFAYAEENRIPMEVHCYPKEDDPEDVCAPVRLRRVLEKHPALRLSAAHLGGFQFRQLTDLGIYANMSAILPELVTRLGLEEANRVLRNFGVDRLMFATDYPASRSLAYGEIYPRYFELLDRMDFSEEEIAGICRGNVTTFLGL